MNLYINGCSFSSMEHKKFSVSPQTQLIGDYIYKIILKILLITARGRVTPDYLGKQHSL